MSELHIVRYPNYPHFIDFVDLIISFSYIIDAVILTVLFCTNHLKIYT